MSSDCYTIRIRSVDGVAIVLDALTGTAGGCNDYANSRSFILLVLWEAPDATDLGIAMAEPIEAIPAAECAALALQQL